MRRLAFGLLVVAFALGGCDLSTSGRRIAVYSQPRKALLVLDVQKDFTAAGARMPVDKTQAESMIRSINAAVSRFRERGDLVVYVRNVFRRGDILNVFRNFAAIEGSAAIAFDERLNVVSDLVFDKSRPDAFSNRELESFLVANRVSEITVTGLFADQCVYWTSRGALNRGYKVNYAVDAVAAGSDRAITRAAESLRARGASIVTARE